MRNLDDHIGFDVDSDTKQQALKAAQRDGRKLSGWMRKLVRSQLDIERRVYQTGPTVQAHQS